MLADSLFRRNVRHQKAKGGYNDDVAAFEDSLRRAEKITPSDLACDDELRVTVEKLAYELEGLTAAALRVD